MPPDPRDDVYVEAIVASVVGMVRAAELGDRLRLIGELHMLLTTIVEHANAPIERSSDEALRRVVARL